MDDGCKQKFASKALDAFDLFLFSFFEMHYLFEFQWIRG